MVSYGHFCMICFYSHLLDLTDCSFKVQLFKYYVHTMLSTSSFFIRENSHWHNFTHWGRFKSSQPTQSHTKNVNFILVILISFVHFAFTPVMLGLGAVLQCVFCLVIVCFCMINNVQIHTKLPPCKKAKITGSVHVVSARVKICYLDYILLYLYKNMLSCGSVDSVWCQQRQGHGFDPWDCTLLETIV